MFDLSSFKPIQIVGGKNSMTISKTGVGISQAAVAQLGKPEYVKILISYTEKKIAIEPTDAADPDRTKFLSKDKKIPIVRWNNSIFKNEISQLMSWNLTEHIYKVEGKFYPEDSLMVFDLNKVKII